MAESKFGVIGGDERQLYLARCACREGKQVVLAGFSQDAAGELPAVSVKEAARQSDVILLPLPVTRDGKLLSARETIPLNDEFAALFAGKKVFGGMTERLRQSSSRWQEIDLQDYYCREELLIGNAVLTAEGAIGIAATRYEGSIFGTKVLVTGFGRIGKALCLGLKGLGARVDCCARKPADLISIEALGCEALTYSEVRGEYDLIFNTVPAPVLREKQLARLSPDAVIYELASAPGGVDLAAAKRFGLRVENLPGLPGQTAPKAAGELIWRTVERMLV